VITLITGVGSKGQVGEAVAAALALRGDTIILVSRKREEVDARTAELTEAGFRASGYDCDLSDAAVVDRLRGEVERDHGDRVDNLVNLAGGFGLSGPLAASDPAALQRLLQINLVTAYLATRAFVPSVANARGSIVFFASEAVLDGARTMGISAYAAAKAGVVALMRSVADEGRSAGFRANALAPGSIRTASNEASMGADAKYVEREDVAAAVLYLCSDAAKSITGQVLQLG